MEPALEIRNLTKRYPGFTLDGVSFTLPRGAVMGLIGPNGAGKTTLIKLILNLVHADGGEVSVFGLDHRRDEAAARARIGFVHDEPRLPPDARLDALAAAVAPFYPKWDAGKCRAMMGEFGLDGRKKFGKLSQGMKTKFALVLALAHDADLILMDEPTTGLDPVFRRDLLQHLSSLLQDDGKSVLFSTHITTDLERTADYITLLQEGRLALSLPKDDLLENWAMVKGGSELLQEEVRPLFRGVRQRTFGVEALTADAKAARERFPSGVVVERATLEDILLLTRNGGSHAS